MASRRTALLAVLLPPAAAWSAAKPGKTLRVGYLSPGGGDLRLLQPALAELGFVDGRNVTYESRLGPVEAADRLARELVASRPDLLIGVLNEYVRSLQRATRSIPIVMMQVVDPVGQGLVKSLSRPGANTTGVTTLAELTWAKTVEIARTFAPRAPAIGLLVAPRNTLHEQVSSIVRDAVRSGGGNVIVYTTHAVEYELDSAFAAAARAGVKVMLIAGGPPFVNMHNEIALIGVKHGVGTAAGKAMFARSGALFGYGMDTAAHYRDVAACVDRIANGADPAILPVMQPSLFEFAINARRVRELGFAIPSALRISAEMVE